MDLETLKQREIILAFNYWENFKYHKEIAQGMGGENPKVRKIGDNVESIRREWNEVQLQIKEIETKLQTTKQTKNGNQNDNRG